MLNKESVPSTHQKNSSCVPVSDCQGSNGSTTDQSSTMAVATVVQKMDAELRCPACRRYFLCPILLPCGHSLCTSCAATALLPSTDPQVATAIQTTLSIVGSDSCPPCPTASYSSASSTSGSSVAGTSQSVGIASSGTSSINVVGNGVSPSSDLDQVSVISETDSGVVVTSRPSSYIGRLPILVEQNNHGSAISSPNLIPSCITHGLICPACNRVVGLFDAKGIGHLSKNRALERIISKFVNPELLQKHLLQSGLSNSVPFQLLSVSDPLNRPGGPLCQLCEESEQEVASFWCEQCEIFYCVTCREKCHPPRGPLLRHCLHSSLKGVEILKRKRSDQPESCEEHSKTVINLYCLNCNTSICQECLVIEGSPIKEIHEKHDLQPLISVCKSKKAELSQALQLLSEKARMGTEYVQCLRAKSEAIQQTYTESELYVASQLETLQSALEEKKRDLLSRLHETRDRQTKGLKERTAQITGMVTRCTGLIQFCIEMLKESDPSAFLLVCQSLVSRTQDTEHQFAQELDQATAISQTTESLFSCLSKSTNRTKQPSRIPTEYDSPSRTTRSPQKIMNNNGLQLANIESIRHWIAELSLQAHPRGRTDDCSQVRLATPKLEAPAIPSFLASECISERNVFTLVWRPHSEAPVDRYTLELDDGANGNFRRVYRGPETICTVEGLHFRSVYRARVKAHNPAGESDYSDQLCLQTSDLTWFHLDNSTAPPEILLTNGNRTVTSQTAEDRVVLGSTGISRGIHYWEFTVDRCDPGGQPAFGIARPDSNKHIMLGSDMRSWSVYFDHKRSWFLHNGEHFERTDGGVRPGTVVGIRFDCDRRSLSFYLNDEPHGPIAFTNLPVGLYYPAVSLSRSVQLTLHTGLEAPSESEESDEDSSGAGTGTETTSMATTVLGLSTVQSYHSPLIGSRPL